MADEILTSLAEGVAEIRFNRPHVLNSIDVAMAEGLREAARRLTADPAVRVIVLAGEGRAFIAGGDLDFLRKAGEDAPAAANRLIRPVHEGLEILAGCRQPVLASLKGPVAGGGAGIAMAADIAIAADDLKFSMAYIHVGASPDCGASYSLPRLVGLRNALAMAFFGETIGAEEALRLGLVNKVVPRAALEEETAAIARQLARAAPLALARTKALLRKAGGRTLAEQLEAERENFAALAATGDFREGLDAFFAKRPPGFTGT